MGMSVRDLDTCSPDAIDAVATVWETWSTAMVGDKAAVDRDVVAPLTNGGWVSKDGKRAVQLIGWVGDQLEAIRAESGAMASVLRAAAIDLRTAQNALRTALVDLAANNMKLDDKDNIVWTAPSPDLKKATEATATGLADRISAALKLADDADEIAAMSMRANTDSMDNKLDFNVNSLGADPIADATRLNDIYTKLQKGEELSKKEMQTVKLLTDDNQGDPAFQVALMQKMGPDTLLAVVAKTNAPATVPNMKDDDLAFIRSSLTSALSGASSQLGRDDAWMSALAAEGPKVTYTQQYRMGTTVHGYQTLSTMLGEGRFDATFLNKAGQGMLDFEKVSGGKVWNATDHKSDPITGLLGAMRNNPEASTLFFKDPLGAQHLDQLLNRDVSFTPGKQHTNMGLLGEALVAAAPPQSTEASVSVVANVTNHFGTNPPQDIPGELKGHVAQMLANNVESVHEGIGEPFPVRFIPDGQGGPIADFNDGALIRTLAGLGGEHMKPIAIAEDMFVITGLNAIRDHAADPGMVYAAFVNDYATTQGVLNSIAVEEVRSDAEDKQDEEAAKIEKTASILGAVATTAPVVGDIAERGINWVAVDMTQKMNESVDADAAVKVADIYDPAVPNARETVVAWMQQNNIDPVQSAVYTSDMRGNFDDGGESVQKSAGH